MHSKNLIFLFLLGIILILASRSVQSQPSICWTDLVLKPHSVETEASSIKIMGKIKYFFEVDYFEKLEYNEVGVHFHLGDGSIESWDHLTLFISKDTNLTIYSRERMTTNTVMGLVRCYDKRRAKEIISELYPGYLMGNLAVDVINDPIIYMGDEHFPKWEYVSLYEGKVVIIYNIMTGDTTLEFVGIKPSDSPVFTLPTFVID